MLEKCLVTRGQAEVCAEPLSWRIFKMRVVVYMRLGKVQLRISMI
jgi:hypothetical protein